MTEQEWLTSKDPIAMLDWVMQLHFRPSDRKLRLAMCAMSRASAFDSFELMRRVSLRKPQFAMCAMSRASAFDSFELMRRVSLAERWADGEIDREAVIASVPGESTSWRDWVVAHHIPRDAAEWASQSYKWVAPFVLREVFGNPFQPVTLPLGEPCRKCKGKGDIPAGAGGAVIGRKERLPCERCKGTGHRPSPVLTPLVLQLAEAAYTVRTGTGTLDNDALAVLSDALEEAGLPERVTCERCSGSGALTVEATPNSISYWQGNVTTELGCGYCGGESVENGRNGSGRQPNPILAHLRDPGPHYRGCWAVDLLLGKE